MKSRFWTFFVYLDSAPENWIELIQDTGVPFCVSPYHDQDVNPDGSIKKAHYHVIVAFDGPTTKKNIIDTFTNPLNTLEPKKVVSLRGMYRYLCHLDNPEKAQYDLKDIQSFNSFEISLTDTEILVVKSKIIDFIDSNDICTYYELVNSYLSSGDMDYFRVVSNNVYFFSNYIRSRKDYIEKLK